ncbi:MAG: hypothetical protein AAGA48_07880 [Myxococcota bacterium]
MKTLRLFLCLAVLAVVGAVFSSMTDAAQAGDLRSRFETCEDLDGRHADFRIRDRDFASRVVDTCEDDGGDFTIATAPETYRHWGCNPNSSCVANCEWCSLPWGGTITCTCRLTGVD